MRARSKKTQQKYKDRAPLVARLLEERPFCEACQIFASFDGERRRTNQSVDIHEVISRGRGGTILEEDNLLAVCRFPCHSRITTDSREAEWLGLAMPSWANEEAMEEAAARRHVGTTSKLHYTPEWCVQGYFDDFIDTRF